MKLGISAVALALISVPAWACTSLPYVLTNGTVANADQVMADLNCLALKGGTTFTGTVEARVDQNAPTVGFKTFNGASGANAQARFDLATATPNSYGIWALMENSGSPYWLMSTGSAVQAAYFDMQAHVFRTSTGVERMRIASSGNVGINHSSPSLLLQVNGTAGGTSAWQVVSDERLKTNVSSVTGALNLIEKLNPVRFDWVKPSSRTVGKELSLPVGERQIGFMAQEVEKIVPEAVAGPGGQAGAIYGLREDKLIPVLVAAIKEQQAEIRALQSEVKLLGGNRRRSLP